MENDKSKISRIKNEAAKALGRLGGLKATEAQRAAARKNGLLGGRPKKILGQDSNRRS